MSNVIKITYLFLIFAFVSCKSEKTTERKYEENSYEVLSTIIDKYAKPSLVVPPPPPEGIPDTLKNKRDSILNLPKNSEWLNQEHIVAIRPSLFELNDKDYYISSIKEKQYRKEVERLFSMNNQYSKGNKSLKIDNLIPTRGNVFIKAPTDDKLSANKKLWYSFDLFFASSQIKFNNDFTKAVLVVGISRTSLNGFSTFLLLEKKNKKWEIVYDRLLTIS